MIPHEYDREYFERKIQNSQYKSTPSRVVSKNAVGNTKGATKGLLGKASGQ
jgi:hypothetical protein